MDDHVCEAVDRLGSPEGALWLRAETEDDVPLDNAAAASAALETRRTHFSP
jgi:hypothetical protein